MMDKPRLKTEQEMRDTDPLLVNKVMGGGFESEWLWDALGGDISADTGAVLDYFFGDIDVLPDTVRISIVSLLNQGDLLYVFPADWPDFWDT